LANCTRSFCCCRGTQRFYVGGDTLLVESYGEEGILDLLPSGPGHQFPLFGLTLRKDLLVAHLEPELTHHLDHDTWMLDDLGELLARVTRGCDVATIDRLFWRNESLEIHF
jgi:hypothetical protein